MSETSTMIPAWYRVADRRRETHDTWTMTLQPTGDGLASFAPGQFSMLYAFGTGEVPISVSGGLRDGGRLVHTVRAVGAVTQALCGIETGGRVGVRGPFGVPWPIAASDGLDIVVVAGGIGLAPLRPVVDHVLAERERYGRLHVLYGGRSPGELLYPDELERWGAEPDVEVGVTVDTAGPEWTGRVGVVTTLVDGLAFEPARTAAFVCGPEIMMRAAATALGDAGLDAERIYLSLERSMKCAVGHCGHCQLRETFICKDGPVYTSAAIEPLMRVPEL